MITATLHTDQQQLWKKEFDDICDAERYAMKVLGCKTGKGIICLVQVSDTMTGEQSEFEF